MKVEIKEFNNKGAAYIGDYGKPDATMTYSVAGGELLIIDHTEVSGKLRGQGAGRKLLDALVAKVREENKKILPLCPYAKSVFDKTATLSDVLK